MRIITTGPYQKHLKQKGFSLIEFGIVLVVIGILIASLSVGQNLLYAAKIRSLVMEFERHQTAYDIFIDKFRALPGDMSDASRYWLHPVTEAPVTADGNGNGQIQWLVAPDGTNYEGPLAWQHLSASGLIENAGLLITDTDFAQPGVTMPGSKYDDGAGFAIAWNGVIGNHLSFGKPNAMWRLNLTEVLPPLDARAIDKKIDDANPTLGILRGVDGANTGALNCFGDFDSDSDTPDTYNIGQEVPLCVLQLKLGSK